MPPKKKQVKPSTSKPSTNKHSTGKSSTIKTDLVKTKEKYEYTPAVHKVIVWINANDRRTSEIMSKFEYTEVISIRAKQIENGGQCFTTVENISDPLDKAKKEIRDKKCPLDIIRAITDTIYERWHVNEMSVPDI